VGRIVRALDLQLGLAQVEPQPVIVAGVLVAIVRPEWDFRHWCPVKPQHRGIWAAPLRRGGAVGVRDVIEVVIEPFGAQVEVKHFPGINTYRGGIIPVMQIVDTEIETIEILIGKEFGIEERARCEAVIFEARLGEP